MERIVYEQIYKALEVQSAKGWDDYYEWKNTVQSYMALEVQSAKGWDDYYEWKDTVQAYMTNKK